MTVIVTERPHECIIRVWHGEDWYDPLPQLVDPVNGDPYDLTGVTVELFARPSFDHATLFRLLTSVAEDGILMDDPALGFISIFLPQATVEEKLPIIQAPQGWRQFMRLTFDGGDLGTVKKHLWTGPLIVYPAKDDPTP